MEEKRWALGETAVLTKTTTLLKKSGAASYYRMQGTTYVCIREESERERGILMKLMGRQAGAGVMLVSGEPFCKDESDVLAKGVQHFGYGFPSAAEVVTALNILRLDDKLRQRFEQEAEPFSVDDTFWVSDTARHRLVQRRLQYMDGRDGSLHTAREDVRHWRLSFVYFYKGRLYR